MTIHQLQIFCAIVENKSFKKAASAFFLTVQSVSLQMRSLEKDLNIKLFKKDGSKSLTDEGVIVYNSAKKVLLELEKMNYLLAERQLLVSDQSTKIKIMTNLDFGTFILPSILAKFTSVA